ncbi:hypothetical protein PF005_g24564 [Phytophthora fragariae]|uniref:Uncharacterized protein n=1 Tax=Phytophthora fragariae TaxID=53985 RepID=A0A6A3QJR9_9STRA|nr:hypothetical protein PF003_g15615 [Phytophthora fragariae]KAE8924439.1 hypothetical protein PF009_g25331 [Phytophthora fragariae]KAE8976915.1 hypothetical protein PF011_g23861 [Phytophthora fragariae]KAE9074715.1 hypothetical protein PF010_g24574 [Phytophthora fragariae]KAE9076616.1 hypothetical protein PF007_g24564 [Phytophthora fragariae]
MRAVCFATLQVPITSALAGRRFEQRRRKYGGCRRPGSVSGRCLLASCGCRRWSGH